MTRKKQEKAETEPQEPETTPETPAADQALPADENNPQPLVQQEAPAAPPDTPEPKPYAEVITGEAITYEGLFRVHQVGKKWYFEIAPDVLGKDMIWYAEFAEAPYGVAASPKELGRRVVRWERDDDAIVVRDMSNTLLLRPAFAVTAAQVQPSAADLAMENVAFPAILFSFPLAAEGEGNTAVIDVTALFAGNILDFDVTPVLRGSGYQAAAPDPARSKIARMRAFPQNLLVQSLLTFPLTAGPSSAATIVVSHSLVLLPQEPMMPRYFDSRVGYFTTDYGVVSADDGPGIINTRIISRYRLEKSDPAAELSDPVQPIVFYLPPEIPERWRPYVRQGIEDWQVAFEGAGFSQAIVAKDAPDAAQDPDWDPSDARYSVIRWVPQPFANAMGPHLADPRTGEILSAHVILWDDVLKMAELWYFTQASAVDQRAQMLPLPADLLGEVVRYIVCHEVGHSLGLRHNHRASQAFSTEQLRDPAFAEQYGPVASIMSYGRFNYVTQPGDGVQHLVPQIGPYDMFAINYGYRPIPGCDSPDAEEEILDGWATAVRDNPWLAFGGEDTVAAVDPTVLTENLGSDRIESARLGIANLERMLEYLVPATSREHEGFELLDRVYRTIIANRTTWLLGAAKELGGVVERRTLAVGEEPFVRVSVQRQREILTFLLENLRRAGPFLRPDIVNRITPMNAIKPVMDSQNAILDAMLAGGVYKQMMDATILNPQEAYPLADYLNGIKDGLFSELRDENPQIDAIMRGSQRRFVTTIKQLLSAYENTMDPMMAAMLGGLGLPGDLLDFITSSGQGTDFRNAARMSLRELRGELSSCLERVTDTTTRAHLEDLLQEVEQILGGNVKP